MKVLRGFVAVSVCFLRSDFSVKGFEVVFDSGKFGGINRDCGLDLTADGLNVV